jgi:hypothetical protein
MINFRLLVIAAVWGSVVSPSAIAQSVDSADSVVTRRLDELDQKQRILERKWELLQEEAAAKAKEAPALIAGKDGFALKSADGKFQLKLRGYTQTDGRFFLGDEEKCLTNTFLLRDAVRLRQRGETLGPEVLERKKARLHRRLQRLIGADYQDKDCKRLVKRLRRHQHELFTFLDHPEVDWHNNHGERQLRPPVVARKNSGGNHSDQGAETQAIMMTVFFTLHLRNQNEVDTVIKMVEEYLKTHQKPTLERKDRSDG